MLLCLLTIVKRASWPVNTFHEAHGLSPQEGTGHHQGFSETVLSEATLHTRSICILASAENRDKHKQRETTTKPQFWKHTFLGTLEGHLAGRTQIHKPNSLLWRLRICACNDTPESRLVLKVYSLSPFERFWETDIQWKIKLISSIIGVRSFLNQWLSYWKYPLVYTRVLLIDFTLSNSRHTYKTSVSERCTIQSLSLHLISRLLLDSKWTVTI